MREYRVRKHGSGDRAVWSVKIGRDVHGDYLSEWAATLDAVDAAFEDGEQGRTARVVIERPDDVPETVWSVGDAYPVETMPGANDNAQDGDRRIA